MEKISRSIARRISLIKQGLGSDLPFSSPQAVLEHLGYVQIDTISVVERAHHHIFWTRDPNYHPAQLAALLGKEKTAFEYWSHAASYLPMRDYRYSLPRKRRYANGEAHWFNPTDEHKKWRRKILAKIKAEGPQSIRAFTDPEFERKRGPGGWFERSPAKQTLEQLFMEGRLMVSGRQGFDKFYELTERFLPAGVDTSFPTVAEQARHMIHSHLRAHGFMRVEEIGHLRKKDFRDLLAREAKKMLREGEIVEIQVEGSERPYLAFSNWAADVSEEVRGVKILSPFDGSVIRRERLRELFDFDYTIECYTPEPKRKFGYFCLPVLVDGTFQGRIDAKADRAAGELQVKKVFAEKGVKLGELREKLREPLAEFARFNGCERASFLK